VHVALPLFDPKLVGPFCELWTGFGLAFTGLRAANHGHTNGSTGSPAKIEAEAEAAFMGHTKGYAFAFAWDLAPEAWVAKLRLCCACAAPVLLVLVV
jgi:hypothetical protein